MCVQKQADLARKRDAERSEREEMESRLKIDNEERMRRLATFQELASNRMAIQQQSLGPLMVNLKQSHAELTEAENLQVIPLHLSIPCAVPALNIGPLCLNFGSIDCIFQGCRHRFNVQGGPIFSAATAHTLVYSLYIHSLYIHLSNPCTYTNLSVFSRWSEQYALCCACK